MSEARIGRVFVASLHQAIADLLPSRLEFYENWLHSTGLRQGTIGLAPLSAVLSFLRREGDAYVLVTRRAGEYAADWTVASLPWLRKTTVTSLPRSLRARAALRLGREIIRATYPGSRAIVKIRRDRALVDIRGSVFCEVREPIGHPLCGYYPAALEKVLEHYRVVGNAEISGCRASGGKGCLVSLALPRTGWSATARDGEGAPES